MDGKKFIEYLKPIEEEMGNALFLDPYPSETGGTARALWHFVACCMTEAFGYFVVCEPIARLCNSDDEITQALKEAEEDIARGVRRVALLLANPNIHDDLSAEFRWIGIVDPFCSHVGFQVRNHPKFDKKYRRFVDKQARRGKSLEQIRRDSRLFFEQLNLKD